MPPRGKRDEEESQERRKQPWSGYHNKKSPRWKWKDKQNERKARRESAPTRVLGQKIRQTTKEWQVKRRNKRARVVGDRGKVVPEESERCVERAVCLRFQIFARVCAHGRCFYLVQCPRGRRFGCCLICVSTGFGVKGLPRLTCFRNNLTLSTSQLLMQHFFYEKRDTDFEVGFNSIQEFYIPTRLAPIMVQIFNQNVLRFTPRQNPKRGALRSSRISSPTVWYSNHTPLGGIPRDLSWRKTTQATPPELRLQPSSWRSSDVQHYHLVSIEPGGSAVPSNPICSQIGPSSDAASGPREARYWRSDRVDGNATMEDKFFN